MWSQLNSGIFSQLNRGEFFESASQPKC